MAKKQAPRVPAKPAVLPEPKAKAIKVMATQLGYYDHARRREGDVFLVDEKHFSSRWMERVDDSTPEKVSTAQESINKQHDELLASKAGIVAGGGEEL